MAERKHPSLQPRELGPWRLPIQARRAGAFASSLFVSCALFCLSCSAPEPECGNGLLEDGEQCDAPDSADCSESCKVLPSHLNQCPDISFLFAAPRTTGLGESIVLEAEATDPDGDDLWFLWAGGGGTFKNRRKAKSSYVCEEEGKHEIALSYGDSRGCEATVEFTVRCAP